MGQRLKEIMTGEQMVPGRAMSTVQLHEEVKKYRFE